MRCYSHLSDDEREQMGLARTLWRDRAGDQPSKIDDRRHITVLFAIWWVRRASLPARRLAGRRVRHERNVGRPVLRASADRQLLLWSALVQSHEFNRAAGTRLEQIKDETVLALWDADKALYAPTGHATCRAIRSTNRFNITT